MAGGIINGAAAMKNSLAFPVYYSITRVTFNRCVCSLVAMFLEGRRWSLMAKARYYR